MAWIFGCAITEPPRSTTVGSGACAATTKGLPPVPPTPELEELEALDALVVAPAPEALELVVAPVAELDEACLGALEHAARPNSGAKRRE
jgi:hypothetical protein